MSEDPAAYDRSTWYRDEDGKLQRSTDNGPLEIEYMTTDFETIFQLKKQFEATCACRLMVNSYGLMLLVQGHKENGGRMIKKIRCNWDK